MLPLLNGCTQNQDTGDATVGETDGKNNNAENSDGKQIPVYKGMTVSPADTQSGSNE